MAGVLRHNADGSSDRVVIAGGRGHFAGMHGVLIDVHTAGQHPDIVTIRLHR
jgi:hypothetical protein